MTVLFLFEVEIIKSNNTKDGYSQICLFLFQSTNDHVLQFHTKIDAY